MNHFFHIEGIAAAIAIFGALGGFLRWLHLTLKNQEIVVTIVRHIYLNHIPHIESALRKLCTKAGVNYEELQPPPVI